MKKLLLLFIILFLSCSRNDDEVPTNPRSNLICGTISFNSNSKSVGNWDFIQHYEDSTLFNSTCPGTEKIQITEWGTIKLINCSSEINTYLQPLSENFQIEKYYIGDEFIEKTFTFENSDQTMHIKYVQNNIQYDFVYHRN